MAATEGNCRRVSQIVDRRAMNQHASPDTLPVPNQIAHLPARRRLAASWSKPDWGIWHGERLAGLREIDPGLGVLVTREAITGTAQPMAADQEIESFIRSTFVSVWSLELTCLLRKAGDRALTHEEMVAALRASDLVVAQSVAALHAAGILIIEANGTARYRPISAHLDVLVGKTEDLYVARPDQVRRIIVSQRTSPLASFANAFKLGEP